MSTSPNRSAMNAASSAVEIGCGGCQPIHEVKQRVFYLSLRSSSDRAGVEVLVDALVGLFDLFSISFTLSLRCRDVSR